MTVAAECPEPSDWGSPPVGARRATSAKRNKPGVRGAGWVSGGGANSREAGLARGLQCGFASDNRRGIPDEDAVNNYVDCRPARYSTAWLALEAAVKSAFLSDLMTSSQWLK